MNQSEQINELVTALAKAQGEILPASKDGINPHFKSRYADLASISSACRPALSKHGLAIMQTMDEANGKLVLVTTLAHSSGQWMRSSLPIISAKQDAQSIGSAITYMRRYGLAAMVGVVADDDDDGERSMPRPDMRQESRRKEPEIKQEACISSQQAKEIAEIIAQCDEKYRNQFWERLHNLSIIKLEQIPLSLYERIKNAAIKKRDELASKIDVLEVAHA